MGISPLVSPCLVFKNFQLLLLFFFLTITDRKKKLSFDFPILNCLSELIVYIIIKDQTLPNVCLVKTE